LALPLSLWWAFGYAGSTGMLAAVIAAGLCWGGSVLALFVRTLFSKPHEVVTGTMGAMLSRMVVIMGGALAIGAAVPGLTRAAFGGQVIVFFLLTLAVETVLAVRWVQSLEAANARTAEQAPSSSENRAEVI
jgi:hypothetical protein